MSKKYAPLIVIVIIVGGLLTWGGLTDWTFSGLLPREGAKCTPEEDGKVTNATEYIYDKDKECTVVNKCETGWGPNTANTACEYSSGGETCTPTGTSIPNGSYKSSVTTGACELTGCSGNFKFASGGCDTCDTGFMLKDGECVDPGLTISEEITTPLAEWGGVIYLDRQNVSCGDDGALNQFKFSNTAAAAAGVNSHQYKYTCVNNIPGFSLGESQTTGNVVTTNNISTDHLTDSNIEVDCNNTPISRFHLGRPSGGGPDSKTIGYSYTCANNSVNSSTCESKKTTAVHNTADVNAILDNDVKCDGKGVITKFKLAKETEAEGGKYYYDYTCCDMY